ncbi:UNVERIFIED_CONTAM: hypothetical protein Slati_2165200 [Sesamum latifolium]|uniref:Reverse transcriptase domain-containing protein n=1 Tax=Sesamum latifolium TaxID=2727402 RepID=A0AAW2WSL4_9LAMI
MAVKIDLTKAYDRVEWQALLKLIEHTGFYSEVIRWISQCITSSSFSLLINGTLFDIFNPSVASDRETLSHPISLSFMLRPEERDPRAVKECLSKFEEWRSQKVNARKSLVHYSRHIPNRNRKILLDILEMNECNHQVKHLGLPFCKPPTRNVAFNELVEKITSKLLAWKA